MEKVYFSMEDLKELEQLEIRGGQGSGDVIQISCTNGVVGCAGCSVDDGCSNEFAGCACEDPDPVPDVNDATGKRS